MEDLDVTPPSPGVPGVNPIQLAVGLVRADQWLVLPLWLLLSVLTPIQLLMSDVGGLEWVLMLGADRFLQMLVCTLIVLRWRDKLEIQGSRGPRFGPTLGKNVLIGGLIWMGIAVPAVIMGTASDPFLSMLAAASTAMCMLVAMRLFFSFAVSGLVGGSLRDVVAQSRLMTLRAPGSAYRAVIGPLAITIAFVAVCSAPYPDGRSLVWTLLTAFAENFFWVASSYTGLAFALVLLDESLWRSSGLEPYRRERLQTLERRGQTAMSRLFAPAGAWKVLIVAVLLLGGTMFRLLSEPPAPQISIVDTVVSDKKVSLTLRVVDPQFKLRGFTPTAFSLRGSSGVLVSTKLLTASPSAKQDETVVQLPATDEPVILLLEFETDRNEKDLRVLTDLHLWYHLHQLVRVEVAPSVGGGEGATV